MVSTSFKFSKKRVVAAAKATSAFFRFHPIRMGSVAESYKLSCRMSAFAALPDGPGGSLVAIANPIIIRQRKDVVTRALQRWLPGIYPFRIFATEGGLMSYGPDIGNQYRLAAGYIDRILRGTKPTELPVQQPTKYELVVNLKTAKALGLTIPPSLLVTADEVIE